MNYQDFNEPHYNYQDIPTMTIEEMLNEITKMPEDSLMEQIISWCEENQYDTKEIGYRLGESEHFKRRLHINCVEHHQMTDILLHDKIAKMEDLDEW
jgi:hypothetical protein